MRCRSTASEEFSYTSRVVCFLPQADSRPLLLRDSSTPESANAPQIMILRIGLAVSLSVAAYILTSQNRTDKTIKRKDRKSRRNSEEIEDTSKENESNGKIYKEIYSWTEISSSSAKVDPEQVKKVDFSALEDEDHPMVEFYDPAVAEVDGNRIQVPDLPYEEQNSIYEMKAWNDVSDLKRMEERVNELLMSKKCVEEELLGCRCVIVQKEEELRQLLLSENCLKEELLGCQRVIEQKDAELRELKSQLQLTGMEIGMLEMKNESLEKCSNHLKAELQSARQEIIEFKKKKEEESNETKERFQVLKRELALLKDKERQDAEVKTEMENRLQAFQEVEFELLRLRRDNKELQHEKRELMVKTEAAETRAEIAEKANKEEKTLMKEKEDLMKKMEELQSNQFKEVEELVYLRWINACLRHELRNYKTQQGEVTARDLNKSLSPRSKEKAKQLLLNYAEPDLSSIHMDHSDLNSSNSFSPTSAFSSENHDFDDSSLDSASTFTTKSKKSSLIHKLKRLGKSKESSTATRRLPKGKQQNMFAAGQRMPNEQVLEHRRTNSGGSFEFETRNNLNDNKSLGTEYPSERRQRAKSSTFPEMHSIFETANRFTHESYCVRDKSAHMNDVCTNVTTSFNVISKSTRDTHGVRLSFEERQKLASERETYIKEKAHELRLRQVYEGNKLNAENQNLQAGNTLHGVVSHAGNDGARDSDFASLNPSDSPDLKRQGDFIQSLAEKVRSCAYLDMNELAEFVQLLDERLSFLVDEYSLLKHFNWPQDKADVLRAATFDYQHLQKLETEVSSFIDNMIDSWDVTHNRMYALLELLEESFYDLLLTQDIVIARYREFDIPTYWLLDTGLLGKIKLACVKLARKYMERIVSELDSIDLIPEKEPQREFLLLQGVRFAYRAHQFAGGFDGKTMQAFDCLRWRARQHVTDVYDSVA